MNGGSLSQLTRSRRSLLLRFFAHRWRTAVLFFFRRTISSRMIRITRAARTTRHRQSHGIGRGLGPHLLRAQRDGAATQEFEREGREDREGERPNPSFESFATFALKKLRGARRF
jgi:hypothetical protein